MKRKLFFWLSVYILTASLFLTHAVCRLLTDQTLSDQEYDSILSVPSDENARFESLQKTSTPVTAGVYVETIKNISLKDSSFQLEFLAWFRWTDNDTLTFLDDNIQIRNGTVNNTEVVADYHENNLHYQELRIDATIARNFLTACYPLGRQVLSFSLAPATYITDEAVLVPDYENSGVNSNLSASGYSLLKSAVSPSLRKNVNTMGNPALTAPNEVSYLAVAMMLNRNSWGLFVQCFIALFGTVGWTLISLYICSHHRADPLITLPPALFGAISNLIVDTNLLPDMVQFGLIEYMNLYGILIILAGTLSIIHINRIRSRSHEPKDADTYGRIMFYTIFTLSLVGMTLIPAAAYQWR